ncbi:AbrB family transcriptional regulator [Mesorhizobium sp. CAU 1741]|uniref:AbrB family transcriptional regulator n=1 Tax=Mesorhizobium sp. CAU 1741 TaxID=3140366 RepID=UPI00325B9FC0
MSVAGLRRKIGLPLLLIASAGIGWLANRAGIPLAWMVAPMILSATSTMIFDLPRLPVKVRYIGQCVVGAAVGLYLTPEALARIVEFAVPILLGAAAITSAACVIALIQIRFAGADPATAVFSNVPGGPMDMALLAHQNGGDPGRTALAQTLRIAMVVLLFPPILFGLSDDPMPRIVEYGTYFDSLLIVLVAIVAGIIAKRLNFINAFFLGPLLVVGAATGMNVGLSHFHEGIVPAAQVLLGVSLGGMFQREVLSGAGRFLGSILATSACLMVVSFLVAEAIAQIYGSDLATMALANAPGAVPEMVVTAQVLHLEVPLVASFQFVRIVFSLAMAAIFFRLYRRTSLILAARKAGQNEAE